MRVTRAVFLLGVVGVLMMIAGPLEAQGFGKNKVQYEPLDWAVLETPHLHLHYYAQEESLARRLAVLRAIDERISERLSERELDAYSRALSDGPHLLNAFRRLLPLTSWSGDEAS